MLSLRDALADISQRHLANRLSNMGPDQILTPVPAINRRPSAPESAHQQWGGSPHRTEHWLSVAEGNCVAERRGGEQPEANDQSIINKMMNSIRPDALASLLSKGEAQNGSRPEREER